MRFRDHIPTFPAVAAGSADRHRPPSARTDDW